MFGTETTEDHRLSLQKRLHRDKRVPFPLSIQHAKNTNMVAQCEECGMWWVVYSKHKLTDTELEVIRSSYIGQLRIYMWIVNCGSEFM